MKPLNNKSSLLFILILILLVGNSSIQNDDINENLDNKFGCQLPKDIDISVNDKISFKQWLTSFKKGARLDLIFNLGFLYKL